MFALLAVAGPGVGVAAPLPTDQALADRVLGDPNAPITIMEFASLTCPHCAAFHRETLPLLKKNYIDTGKAKLIYRDFPTKPVALATAAAMLARCAPANRYFGFLSVMFRGQEGWVTSGDPLKSLAQIGQLGGVSPADFEACLNNEALFKGIRASQAEASSKYGVGSTPTFIINGSERIVGAEPYETFRKILDALAE